MTEETKWLTCPKCGKKTRIKQQKTTKMKDFLLYCHWCKTESVVNVDNFEVTVIRKDK